MNRRLPLNVRLAMVQNRETEKPQPIIVPCAVGDSVIVAVNGRYRNGVVECPPWFCDEGRYVMVRTDEGAIKLRKSAVVKVESA